MSGCIYLDPRVGSGELLPYFKPYDVPVEVTQLDFGDACWYGNGPDGPCVVGVERKVLSDLVASMRDKRLSGWQLPGLFGAYQFVNIIVEGIWQCGEGGVVEVLGRGGWVGMRVGSRPVMYREVDHYLSTLEYKRGVVVARTASRQQTVAWLVSRFKWWNDKEWEKHDSDSAIYAPFDLMVSNRRGKFFGRAPGPWEMRVERVACQLPGIEKKAYEFGKEFGTVQDMVNSNEARLVGIDGIGKKLAGQVYRWLRGGEK